MNTTIEDENEIANACETISKEVFCERINQLRKWGRPDRPKAEWLVILMEEVGEIAKAILEDDHEGYREEVVQVAAVAFQMIENFDKVYPIE